MAIFTPDGNGGGSGVVITADGYAVSNFHVTSPVGDYLKCGMTDGRLYDAVIVSIDPTGDVALIKLLGRTDFVAAELGDSDQVRAGDWCFAVGNPFLLATDFQPSVSFRNCFGCPSLSVSGRLDSRICRLHPDGCCHQSRQFGRTAVQCPGTIDRHHWPRIVRKARASQCGRRLRDFDQSSRNFLGHLQSGAIVDHATLGATVDRDEQGRVVVSNILESSDAYRRGLRYGDEVVAFGGRPIPSVNAFKNVLGIFPSGWRVPLSYRRDGERHDVYVRLAGVHTKAEMQKMLQRPAAPDELPRELPPDQEPKKGDKPPRPQPRSRPHPEQPKVEVPPEAAKMIVPRAGFKNYYFNELNRQRVWSQFSRRRRLCHEHSAVGGNRTAGKRRSIFRDARRGRVETRFAQQLPHRLPIRRT